MSKPTTTSPATTIKPEDYTHSPLQEQNDDKIMILLDRRDNHNRETPLHVVVRLTDMSAAKVLAGAGADILLQNADGCNVLQEAIMRRCSDVVSILVQHHHLTFEFLGTTSELVNPSSFERQFLLESQYFSFDGSTGALSVLDRFSYVRGFVD
ncbi:hypothetical protein CQW23_05996 [Capsicum baccatum]|uniref:Uncharacterized protein n=1 Tax=Capsicum baccatum TaxID=33114 RepID=A0A2G2X221_CAPBA|nr:hypothetical protein CQW23_05996 [Capsicum baccatum]